MQFSETLSSLKPSGDTWTAHVSDDWLNGRTVFGGLQAALALAAMRKVLPQAIPLRTLQITFLAPVGGGAVSLTAKVLRTGKSAVHVESRIVAGEQTLALCVGVFGARRESVVTVTPQQPAFEALPKPIQIPFVPGVSPIFLQHFSLRWLRGGLPYSGSKLTDAVMQVGLHDSAPTGEAQVLALADAPPPLAITLLKKFAPGSSMTWMLEFLSDDFHALPLQNWRLDIHMNAAAHGYTGQSVMVWGPGGEAVAYSRQSMVVFG